MKVIEKKTSDLRPYENNPRKNDAAVDKVAASIKEFGFKVPLVITEDGEVVAGHTRLKAAEQLGIKKIPCVVASDLTPEQIKAFRLADNKVAEFSSWDDELLEMELGAFSEIDMSVFGFDGLEAEESAENIEEDDFNEKKTRKHNVEAGQIWVCGKHRVMCGDSTIKEDADRIMNGELADFVFTDPPYGVAIGDKNKMLDEVGGGKKWKDKNEYRGRHAADGCAV